MSISRYAHCIVEFEPKGRGTGCTFINKINDDKIIPKRYIESVKQGIFEAMEGHNIYPITDIKATLYDGSYYERDASEMNYKVAAFLAVKEMCKAGDLLLLEPILKFKIKVENVDFNRIKNLVVSNEGKTEDGQDETEKIILIPLRRIIGEAPEELKVLAKQSLLIDVNYTEISEDLRENIADDNDANFGKTYYVDILKDTIPYEYRFD